jgi:flagellar protein FlaG
MIDIKPINMPEKNPVPVAQTQPATQKGPAALKGRDAQAGKEPDLAELKELVADVQKNIHWIADVDLQFSVHESSGKVMVTVRDKSTGEVVREIPPSEFLDLSVRIEQMIGLIFNEQG